MKIVALQRYEDLYSVSLVALVERYWQHWVFEMKTKLGRFETEERRWVEVLKSQKIEGKKSC